MRELYGFRRGWLRRSVVASLVVAALSAAATSLAFGRKGAGGSARGSNPVLAGDHPDPSIIRVGGTFWTTSTSGDWSPQFVLYRSTDLRHWVAAGAVFPHQPDWAVGDFWAPELVSDGGRVLVYYVGRNREKRLCVAVATAARPEGLWTDHGPMVCEEDGSIDPAFARDEHGKAYLIWKEDGNSQRKATPLWAQPLTGDLLHLTGEKTRLIENDPASWEGGVVEAPYVLRHGGMFYLFYAGNACCGTDCNYAEGVARAEHLLGPWEKDPGNPVIRANGSWKCPGHGSAVRTAAGEDYFLYHAYPAQGSIYLGRESVLDRITWGADGWPVVNGGNGTSAGGGGLHGAVVDQFPGARLSAEWRWPVNDEPAVKLARGEATLTAEGDREEFVARSPGAADYTAAVSVAVGKGGMGSLAVVASERHAIGLGVGGGGLELWREDGTARTVLWHGGEVPRGSVELGVDSSDGGTRLRFRYRTYGGAWKDAGEAVDVSRLPAWDQGLRVGLMATGGTAGFRHFSLRTQ